MSEEGKDKKLIGFLHKDEIHSLSTRERLIAIIWWYHYHDTVPVHFSQIVSDSSAAGYPGINTSREKTNLRNDRRVSSHDKGASFRVAPSAITSLNQEYCPLVDRKEIPKSNTLLDAIQFENTRGYIKKVVAQINHSYDEALYDCCSVMIRRLLETLIIETYESLGRDTELKQRDDNFMMFSGLLSYLEKDKKINVGRQTMSGLKAFKNIADSSAHNRRFNASQKDIDDKIDGIRLSVAELVQIAFGK